MDMAFYQETKIKKLEDTVAHALWGKEKVCWCGSDSDGASGGLITMWNPDFLQLISISKGKGYILVHGLIKFKHQERMMNFVNVYAPRPEKEKMLLWESLVALKSSFEGDWIIGGDFNSVLSEDERSRSVFNEKDALLFQELIQAMGVMDLPLKGKRFTWGNRNGASRLDRFLISPEVLSTWPKVLQSGLEKGLSDHAAISFGEEVKHWGFKPFKILNAWLEHPGLKGRVKEAWGAVDDSGWKGFTLQRKLARVRRMISLWNKKRFGDVNAKQTKTKAESERLRTIQDSRSLSEEEALRLTALQKIIWVLEVQDERIWRQKSRINWLRLGDQNTNYFHRMATWRAKKNSISCLMVEGRSIEDPVEIKRAAKEYFTGIFRRPVPCLWALNELFSGSLSDEQRNYLEMDIPEEEIMGALNDCDGNKAPGPDGFNINFYKNYWLIVREEVVGLIVEFCKNGRLLKGINKTFIALIPKSAN